MIAGAEAFSSFLASLKSLFQPASHSISAFEQESRARPDGASPLDPSPPTDMGWSSRFETGTVAKPPVPRESRRHEEVAEHCVFVLAYQAYDTKNRRILGFTCLFFKPKTRRNRECLNLRVM